MIDSRLVRELIEAQFPQWSHLEVREVENGGWDNRSFRVGDGLVARFPSAQAYAAQIEKEQRWLPTLARDLPLPIPSPVAEGRPGPGFPWKWSMYRWIEGTTWSSAKDVDSPTIAGDLGGFLTALHRVDATAGPRPGTHNFGRGGDLRAYDGEVSRALALLQGRVDERAALALWKRDAGTRWHAPPVWVHGDISPGNLLVREGRLAAVIDFGNLAVGDPACDLAIAWSWLDDDARREFKALLPLDEETWLRGRAWALWKASIVAAGLTRTNAADYSAPIDVIERCLEKR